MLVKTDKKKTQTNLGNVSGPTKNLADLVPWYEDHE